MTCIVGVVDRGAVYIGGDSAGVSGYDITIRADKKVFRNGEFLIGFTSSFRMGQILEHSFTPPPLPEEPEKLFRCMARDFADALREAFRDKGFASKSSGQESGGVFLVGVRGRLFRVDNDYHIGEAADGFDAVGCGEAYAKGSLFSNAYLRPDERIREALQAAAHFSAGVRAPFTVLANPPPVAASRENRSPLQTSSGL